MTYEQKQEAIKALVYGGTEEAAADAAGVPVSEMDEITQDEIDEVRADLFQSTSSVWRTTAKTEKNLYLHSL